MRKVFVIILTLWLLIPAFSALDIASEEGMIIGANRLYDGLDEDTEALLEDVTPTGSPDFGKTLLRLLSKGISGSEGTIRTALRSGGLMIGTAVLCACAGSLGTGLSDRAAVMAGALAITAVCTGDLSAMLGLAAQTTEKVESFTKLLLPVMASALAASGGAVSGGALYAGSMLFFSVLSAAVRSLLTPMVLTAAALSAADCAMPDAGLDRLRELIVWAATLLLKGIMYLFTAYLTITGLLSGSADAMALKAAKAALSGVLPVVGSIVSDASETVLASAGTIKTSVGLFGMLAVLAICLHPFLKIAVSYLVLRLTTALSAPACLPPHTKLLENLCSSMGLLLAMNGCQLLMALISVTCFLKVVPG